MDERRALFSSVLFLSWRIFLIAFFSIGICVGCYHKSFVFV
jgi:hypothetical protein